MIRAVRADGAVPEMPIARYFFYVGGVLLALLFAADAFVPKEPVGSAIASATTTENPTLRIRSDRKWPEPVVYDTSLPTIVPPKVEIAAAVPPPAAEASAKSRVRESFAQFKPADDAKPEAKPRPKRKVAKVRAVQPTMRVAQQRPFGFFANNFW
jgi:hypothetical protein